MHIRQLAKSTGDHLKGVQHARLQCGFHRGERQVGLIIFVLVVILGNRVAIGVQFLRGLFFCSRRTGHNRGHNSRRFALFFKLVTERGLKVDHVAQQNIFGQQFVAPDGNRLECQRAFAKPQNHRIATGLNTLGNRNFAFTRQQLNTAHFAQIHPHRVISTVQFFSLGTAQDNFARTRHGGHISAALRVFGLFGLFLLGDLNAHFGQHRHDVFDLIRRYLLWRQDRVQLVICDIATLAGIRDHLFDCRLGHIKVDVAVLVVLAVVVVFSGHKQVPSR